jgi:signal transduction histidine kinase
MKRIRSLTLLLSVQIIISCALVIGANRLLAKHFITMDVYQSVEAEMLAGLAPCADLIEKRADFLTCYRTINAENASRYVSDAFVICGVNASRPEDDDREQCNEIDPAMVKWLSPTQSDTFFQRLVITMAARPEWVGLRLNNAPDSPRILINKRDTSHFLDRLWGYRDNHLLLVLPFIVLLCAFVALLAIRLMMVPIASLERSLLKLSADNFNPSDVAYARFKEFDGLTRIYQDLRIRLDDSFRKARNFTAYASHELKTPLTILRGNAERLIAELPIGTPTQLRARNMADEVERLIDITNKLLTLSRADSKVLLTQREDFNISSFLEQLAEDAAAFQDDIRIEADIAPGVIWHCDPVLVKQLVHNLYSNAMKYNRPRGHIGFKLQRLGDALALTITNTSHHLSADLATHAFDRFYRGDASRNRGVDGLGLGLSICQEIANVHKGTLQFVLLDHDTAALTLTAPLHF